MTEKPKYKNVNRTHMRRLAKVCADMLINRTEPDWRYIELEVVFLRDSYYPRGIPRGRRVELTETTDRRIVRAKPMLDFLHSKGYIKINSWDIQETKRIASIRATMTEKKLMKHIVDFSQDVAYNDESTEEGIESEETN